MRTATEGPPLRICALLVRSGATMPKLFPIHIEVEEMYVGRVYRMLDGMDGVAKIALTGLSAKTKPNGADHPTVRKPRGPYKKFDVGGDERIAQALFKNSPMTASQLAEMFTEEGRSPKSVNSCVHTMKKRGDVVQDPKMGGYMLTKKMRDRMRHRVTTKKARR